MSLLEYDFKIDLSNFGILVVRVKPDPDPQLWY